MICDVCKKKIAKELYERVDLESAYILLYLQEHLQMFVKALNHKKKIKYYLIQEDIDTLRDMLDKIELIIGRIVPYIEGETK